MSELDDLHNLLRARPAAGAVNLAGYDPADTAAQPSRRTAEAELARLRTELFDLHGRLTAECSRSVLLVLQGLDCSGKDGTIKHVVIGCNPAGVKVASFVEPTKEEEDHEFLWRYRQCLPPPGHLGVFNRSYYEDAIVPLACATETAEVVDDRIERINEIETELHASGTVVVKCFLHLSYDEQRRRFLRRLRRDDKRWKFSESDLQTRRRWNEFQAAYGSVLARTSPDHAPWLVIPADNKWYRNWLVARVLRATLTDMNLDYPRIDLDLDRLELLLRAPN